MMNCTKLKLKPCPFCGGEVRMLPQWGPVYGYTVDCTICNAMIRVLTHYKRQAAAAWNTRKSNESV